jgi:hypothetical protein
VAPGIWIPIRIREPVEEWQEELALVECFQWCMSYQNDDNIARQHDPVFGRLGKRAYWNYKRIICLPRPLPRLGLKLERPPRLKKKLEGMTATTTTTGGEAFVVKLALTFDRSTVG